MALKPLNSVDGFSVGITPANIILANGDITTTNLTANGITNLGNLGNVIITGGTSNYILSTNGSGNLSWIAPAGGGGIAGSNTQVQYNDGGSFGASVGFTFDKVTTTLTANNFVVTTDANLGALGNVTITGGSNGQAIITDGNGNLTFGSVISNSAAPMPYNIPNGNSYIVNQNFQGLFNYPITIDGELEVDGILIEVGDASGGNGTPGGSNTQIQYNDSGVFGGNSAFVFNESTGNVTLTGNLIGGNTVSATYLVGDGGFLTNVTATGNTAATQLQNGTSLVNFVGSGGNILMQVGGVPNVFVASANGVVVSDIIVQGTTELGAVGNVSILGGTNGYVLQTNGSGGLSWVAQSGGGGGGSNIANGTSNVTIATSGGNVTTSVNGTSNVLVVTATGANITGTANVTGNITAGNVAATTFTGALSGAATTAGTVTTAAQPNITSVGTLSSLGVSGAVTASTLVSNVSTGTAPLTVTSTTQVANLNAATAGTVRTAAQPNITSVGTLTGLDITGNIYVGGNLVVDGNISYLNIETLGIEDPLISLGGGPNGNALTSNDGKDRGTLLQYYTTQPVTAFMGWDTGNGEFAFGSNVSVSSEIVTYATFGNVRASTFIGSLSGNATTAGTVTTAAQPNITSVGTLASLTVSGNINSGNVSTTGTIAATGNVTGGNVTAIGNISGGNLTTAGVLNVTGNATAGNLGSTGAIVATGNVTGGNVTATGNVTGGNLTTAGVLSVTGNATAGNLSTGGIVNATGNVTGGNLITGGIVTATGNVTGGNIISSGNFISTANGQLVLNSGSGAAEGAQIVMAWKGVNGITGQANGTWNLDVDSSNNYRIFTQNASGATAVPLTIYSGNSLVLASGNVSAPYFLGDGGLLSNISGGGTPSSLVNGNSNVVVTPNSAILMSVAGNANILLVSGTGAAVTGLLSSTGNMTSGNYHTSGIITASQLISNIATGTAPFVVTSTTQVANLNAATAGTATSAISAGTATVATTAGTVTTAAQPNITSTGTLTSVAVTGNATAGNVYANSGTIGASLLTGTLTTAAQPNITSTGTLTSLAVTGNASAGNINAGNLLTANFVAGTLTTASQPNVTSLGTLSSVTASGNITSNANVVTDLIVGRTSGITITAAGTNQNINLVPTGTGKVNVGNFIISNVATPVASTDAATKQYVDDVAQGLHTHDSCNAATQTTLASISSGTVTYNNGTSGVGATLTTTGTYTTIDGVTLSNGMRILVKNEATAANNGIYVRTSATVLTRADDFDTPTEMAGGDFTFVTAGTLYDNTGWVMPDPVTTVGTTAVVWVQFSGAGTYTAGTGLTLTGSQFSITNTAVSAGSYGNGDSVASFTVNGQGQLTAAANVVITANAANLSGTTLKSTVVTSSLTSVGTLGSLSVTGNISAGNVSATTFTGALTGSASGSAATVTTAAQQNITSVGTLTGLGVNGTITGVNITANTGVFSGNGSSLTALNASNVSSGTLAQARLANASVTLGSTALTLGSTVTTVAGLTSVTSTTFVGALTGAATSATTAGTVTTAAQPNITSTGTLTSLAVTGNISAGNVSATTFTGALSGAATTAGTVTTAAQPNITSLGTLSSLTVSGNVSTGNVSGTLLTGTLATAAQPNVTSVGTLTGLGVNGTITGVNITANSGVFAGSGANLTTLNASNVSSGTLAQARLANAAVTLGSTALTLGGTVTTVAGLTSVTSTTFVGALTGAASSATTAGTVTTAAQPNITSTGTLTSLSVTGNISGGNISTAGQLNVTGVATSGGAVLEIFNIGGTNIALYGGGSSATGRTILGWNRTAGGGEFDIITNRNGGSTGGVKFYDWSNTLSNTTTEIFSVTGTGAVTTPSTIVATGNITGGNVIGTLLTGTLSTAAQPNITSVGTLSSLLVTGNITSANVKANAFMINGVTTGITAAGTQQSNATALTTSINIVTTTSSGTGVALPTAVGGMMVSVINAGGNSLAVYPAVNGVINSQSANVAYSLVAGGRLQFVAGNTTQWYTLGATYA